MKDIKFDNGIVKLDLKVGINLYDTMSCVLGKSYMPTLLANVEDAPEIIVIDDEESYANILKVGIERDAEGTIYFFDRASVLMSRVHEDIIYAACKHAVILIDDKYGRFDHDTLPIYLVELTRTANRVEVCVVY